MVFDNAQAQTLLDAAGGGLAVHRAVAPASTAPTTATTCSGRRPSPWPRCSRGAGYATAAVIANGNIDVAFGLGQGFDYYKYLQQVQVGEVPRSVGARQRGGVPLARPAPVGSPVLPLRPHHRPAPPLRPAAAAPVAASPPRSPTRSSARCESVDRLNGDKASVTPELLAALTGLYDAEVAANDAAFGALVAALKARGLYESSVIVVLSDHGEELFDHSGFSHGNTLFEEVLHVPLAIRFPDRRPPKRVTHVVEQVDLMPSLLGYLGVETPAPIQGRSFLTLCGPGEAAGWKDRAVAYLHLKDRHGTSYLDGSWKLLLRPRGETTRRSLFDRREDRRERRDQADRQPDLVRTLEALLERLLGEAGPALDGGELEDEHELREQLKALGYL